MQNNAFMENYIPISFLNDFIFCPRSIYFHQLYGQVKTELYQETFQVAGKAAHQSIDEKKYSTKKVILQSHEVYCEKYKILGKIDVFDAENGKLVERKKSIQVIYDGYVFQVYAQYFSLIEMGFEVQNIVIHDLSHNKNYPIPLPHEDLIMFEKFENLIQKIHDFDLFEADFQANENKCRKCIYRNLCDYSLC